jgi:SAM-dependent methyltransferase
MTGLVELLKKIYHKLPEPPSSYYIFRNAAVDPYAQLPPNAIIFDIGSKDGRAEYSFGSAPADATVVCVDIEAGPGVDLVADAHNMSSVANDSVDCVLTVSTLEHVRYPAKVVAEIHRILKPGGTIFVEVPFIFPYHADPDDFYRFSHRGIQILCEAFERLDSGFNRGPASTMHHLFVHFFAILFSFNSKTLYGINVDILKWLLFWVKYLDIFIARFEMAYVIQTGSYFVGRKKSAP